MIARSIRSLRYQGCGIVNLKPLHMRLEQPAWRHQRTAIDMSDKDPTTHEANFAIRGDAKSLQQLSTSGKAAQSRRRGPHRQEDAAASSSAAGAASSSEDKGKGKDDSNKDGANNK
ncbi:MAG: hypothetical protein Q9177_003284 [Variospora cf. flavescens]